jgi:hypothetical protein
MMVVGADTVVVVVINAVVILVVVTVVVAMYELTVNVDVVLVTVCTA